MVDPHQGKQVSPGHRRHAVAPDESVQYHGHSRDGQVGDDDVPELAGAEQGAVRQVVAVIPPAPGLLGRAVGASCDMGDEVPRPAYQLLEQDPQEYDDGRVLDHVIDFYLAPKQLLVLVT